MVSPSRHRRLRRQGRPLVRIVILAAGLALLVIVGNSIVTTSAEGPDPGLVYADTVRPAVDRSTRQGAALADLRSTAGQQGATGLRRGLDRLVSDSRAVARDVESTTPPTAPRRLVPAHGLLVTAVSTRAIALSDLLDALTADPAVASTDATIDALVEVGRDLAVSDQAYELFVGGLPKTARTTMPDSRWITDEAAWDRPEMATLVATVRASASLAPVHDVAILAVTTDPSPVGTDGQTRVLPTSRTLRLQVVVANAGNQAQKRVAIEAVVRSAGGVDTARQFIDLGPGQRQAVALSLRPSPVGTLEVNVRAGPVPEESALADNEQSTFYVMR